MAFLVHTKVLQSSPEESDEKDDELVVELLLLELWSFSVNSEAFSSSSRAAHPPLVTGLPYPPDEPSHSLAGWMWVLVSAGSGAARLPLCWEV